MLRSHTKFVVVVVVWRCSSAAFIYFGPRLLVAFGIKKSFRLSIVVVTLRQ